jgi:succinate dehydrogenase / fumarate reductase membrane anchor subunit
MSGRLITSRKAAAGLGSAKSGTGHFIAQRVTAIALVPLVAWFLYALVTAYGGGYANARGFVADPVSSVLLLLLVTAAFHHMQAGLRVVIEDYVGGHAARAALLILNAFAAVVLWVVAVVSILTVVL